MIIPITPKEYVNLMKTNITLFKKIFCPLLFLFFSYIKMACNYLNHFKQCPHMNTETWLRVVRKYTSGKSVNNNNFKIFQCVFTWLSHCVLTIALRRMGWDFMNHGCGWANEVMTKQSEQNWTLTLLIPGVAFPKNTRRMGSWLVCF